MWINLIKKFSITTMWFLLTLLFKWKRIEFSDRICIVINFVTSLLPLSFVSKKKKKEQKQSRQVFQSNQQHYFSNDNDLMRAITIPVPISFFADCSSYLSKRFHPLAFRSNHHSFRLHPWSGSIQIQLRIKYYNCNRKIRG